MVCRMKQKDKTSEKGCMRLFILTICNLVNEKTLKLSSLLVTIVWIRVHCSSLVGTTSKLQIIQTIAILINIQCTGAVAK